MGNKAHIIYIGQGSGSISENDSFLKRQRFVAEEGQTEFIVSEFPVKGNILDLIDGAENTENFTRFANIFTCGFPLTAGQIVKIFG